MNEENKDQEYKEEKSGLTGFDSASPAGETPAEPQETAAPEETPQEPQGYTVSPDGSGYYVRHQADIIQDEVNTAPAGQPEGGEAPSGQTPPEEPKTDYRPNGTYGAPDYSYGYTPYGTQQQPPLRKPKREKVKKPHQRYSAAVVVIAAVLAAIIGAVSGTAVYMSKSPTASTSTTSSGTTASNVSINIDKQAESVVQAVAEKATQSVVGIRTTTSVNSFFGGSEDSTGEGSGVIYSADGYIITNYHVIESVVESSTGSKIEVFLGSEDSKSYTATVVGYNVSSDLAVLKISATGLTPVEIGNSDNLKVGQYVITIGSPGGLEFMGSVTYGVISGLNRTVSSGSNVALIQTDAAINPGNSGGALLNTSGQLIGINSSKIVSTEYEGMGFSIPVNTVVEKCKKIIEKQNDPEPYIGITVSEKYTADVLKAYGYPAGAVVLSVDDGSPASTAGIQRGDIITSFNGTDVTTYSMLSELLSDCTPGKSVAVKIYRSGRYYSTNIKIGSDSTK